MGAFPCENLLRIPLHCFLFLLLNYLCHYCCYDCFRCRYHKTCHNDSSFVKNVCKCLFVRNHSTGKGKVKWELFNLSNTQLVLFSTPNPLYKPYWHWHISQLMPKVSYIYHEDELHFAMLWHYNFLSHR